MKDYHVNIFYSQEDEGYIADIPDLPMCSAFGATPMEALEQVEAAKDDLKQLKFHLDDAPVEMWLTRLREIAKLDLPLARQEALLRLIWQEAYLPRQGLVASVATLLGRDCFGSNWQVTFRHDMASVRQALVEAGHRLAYSREHGGYYIEGRPLLDEQLQRLIAGAVAEVDPRQIAIYRQLSPAQRIWQLAHLSDWLRQANERRLHRERTGQK